MLNAVTAGFESQLRAALPEAAFREVSDRYLEELRGRFRGQGGLVLAPATTEEVRLIVRACCAERVPLIPFSGGTGLVAGQVFPEGPAPVILSLERMTAVRGAYPKENVLEVEAGMILEDVHRLAAGHNRMFPLTIASKGSARIGGILAANAGGVNVLRYGNARALCLGIEVVLPNGEIWNGLSRLRKDNAGYDLRDLIIGAEGTLGVITAASLSLVPVPADEGAAILAVPSPEAALDLLSVAREQLGDGVTAFELIHRQGLDFMAQTDVPFRAPFDQLPEWMVLVDVGLPAGLNATEALEALFSAGAEQGLCSDGVISSSAAHRQQFWDLRENIPEANRRIGAVSSHDISVPSGAVSEFIARAPAALAKVGEFRVNCFGHLGDGNLHYNVFPLPGKTRADHHDKRDAIKRAVHDLVHSLGGSVAAEHGVGRLKVGDLERYGDPAKLSAMRAIKAALDPAGIMNPGAVLRA